MRVEIENYIKSIKDLTTISPKNVFEIGSKTGDDAVYIANSFNILEKNVYVFEPHAKFNKSIKEKYPNINLFQQAVFNENAKMVFYEAENLDDGRSSLLSRDIYNKDFTKKNVNTVRMDKFLKDWGISQIDLLKLDVEGASYEVLEGFGKRLKDLKSVQIETEQYQIWKGQKTSEDVYDLLTQNGFVKVWELRLGQTQFDSVWVHNNFVK